LSFRIPAGGGGKAYNKIHHWIQDGKKGDFHAVRLEALLEVGPGVFFSLLVIAVAFMPVFTLVDQEGRLFKPLAYSKNFAMAINSITALWWMKPLNAIL